MKDFQNQKNLIFKDDWECLIVLDACRYDYFESVYQDYLPKGSLQKVLSEGSSTGEWLRNTFQDKFYEDIVYVSSNAFVNSKGANLAGFDGRKHFFKVIDVWDEEWDDEMKTVPPERVRRTALMTKAKFPEKRIIAHFMQPHYPYLSIGPVGGGIGSTHAARQRGVLMKIRRKVGRLIKRTMGREIYKKLKKFGSGGRDVGKIGKVVRERGESGLRRAYMKNLVLVLREARKIVDRYPEKSIITADHGEMLGEDGYGHPSNSRSSVLRKVPWWEPD